MTRRLVGERLRSLELGNVLVAAVRSPVFVGDEVALSSLEWAGSSTVYHPRRRLSRRAIRAGVLAAMAAAPVVRRGRATSSPPQLGQTSRARWQPVQ